MNDSVKIEARPGGDPLGSGEGPDGVLVDRLMRQFHAYLAQQQLRATRQRNAIARAFFESDGHLNVQQLLALVRDEFPEVGQATVYRTLKLLTDAGLATECQFGERERVYERAGDAGQHDHLICRRCGFVVEFVSETIENEQNRIASHFGFSQVHRTLELYGLCPKARGVLGGACPNDGTCASQGRASNDAPGSGLGLAAPSGTPSSGRGDDWVEQR